MSDDNTQTTEQRLKQLTDELNQLKREQDAKGIVGAMMRDYGPLEREIKGVKEQLEAEQKFKRRLERAILLVNAELMLKLVLLLLGSIFIIVGLSSLARNSSSDDWSVVYVILAVVSTGGLLHLAGYSWYAAKRQREQRLERLITKNPSALDKINKHVSRLLDEEEL